jgi:Circularly permutated YpsA SLOG family
LLKIISGGQTGVDRGALDAALDLGLQCGGWCPVGRLAEDGIIPERYPVTELTDGGYAERTAKNVADSDGTLIISNGKPIGGTHETVERCVQMQKSYVIIDCKLVPINQAIDLALGFVYRLLSRSKTPIRFGPQDLTDVRTRVTAERTPARQGSLGTTVVLNVAGPRASQWPEGHALTYQIMLVILRRISGQSDAN